GWARAYRPVCPAPELACDTVPDPSKPAVIKIRQYRGSCPGCEATTRFGCLVTAVASSTLKLHGLDRVDLPDTAHRWWWMSGGVGVWLAAGCRAGWRGLLRSSWSSGRGWCWSAGLWLG